MWLAGVGYGILSFLGIFFISGILNRIFLSFFEVQGINVVWAVVQIVTLPLSAAVVAFLLLRTRAYKFPWVTGVVSALIYVPVFHFLLMFSEYIVTKDFRIVLALFLGQVGIAVVTAIILKRRSRPELPVSKIESVAITERTEVSGNLLYLSIIGYIVSLIFIFSGALNTGVSGFFMAVPFMFLSVHLARKINGKRILFWFAILLSLCAIFFNSTIHKNSFFFPILEDGYVEILRDGYHEEFSDGSGGFSATNTSEIGCIGCGPITYTELKKGDVYKVTGIKITHPDFGTKFVIDTEIGQFSEYDYKGSPLSHDDQEAPPIKLNKEVMRFSTDFGVLMVWPIIPLTLLSAITNGVR